jgi:hypothetical protein
VAKEEAEVSPVSRKKSAADQGDSPRPRRRERRTVSAPPSGAEVAAEAAAIYPDTFGTPPTAEEIAAEAYAIYQARGGGHGRHEDDWFEAERRVAARKGAAGRPEGNIEHRTKN